MQPEDIKTRIKFEDAIAAAVDQGEDENTARADLLGFIRRGKLAAYHHEGEVWVMPKEFRSAANGDS